MKNFLTNNLYILFLFLFTFLYLNYKVKPKLRDLNFYDKNVISITDDSTKYQNNLVSIDNRFTIGKSFFFKDNKFWYRVIQLSFWRKEYINLRNLANKLDIKNKEVKVIQNNNFALGKFRKEKVVLSCFKDPSTFYYEFYYKKLPKSNDFDHWREVFVSSIKDVFYSFKTRNYECLFIITSNTKFFEKSEKEINEIFHQNFFYD